MMKKILVAGRPYSNGGDFLIYDRIVRVLKKAYPEASVELNLDNDAQFQIEKLNEYDAIVTGGGGRSMRKPMYGQAFSISILMRLRCQFTIWEPDCTARTGKMQRFTSIRILTR